MKLIKQYLPLLLVALFVVMSVNDADAQRKKRKKKKKKDAVVDTSGLSYNYGILLGASLAMQGVPADSIKASDLVAGLEAALNKQITDDRTNKAQEIFMGKMKAMEDIKNAAQFEEEKGWFEENAKKNPKLKTTASGIQYEVLKEGTGPKPTPQNQVTTHYHGMLTNGDVFDSSVDRGQPATFPVTGVIQGWQEILVMMPVGSKWKIYIPSSLAYGSRGVGSIPPNSILIFEIELLEIKG